MKMKNSIMFFFILILNPSVSSVLVDNITNTISSSSTKSLAVTQSYNVTTRIANTQQNLQTTHNPIIKTASAVTQNMNSSTNAITATVPSSTASKTPINVITESKQRSKYFDASTTTTVKQTGTGYSTEKKGKLAVSTTELQPKTLVVNDSQQPLTTVHTTTVNSQQKADRDSTSSTSTITKDQPRTSLSTPTTTTYSSTTSKSQSSTKKVVASPTAPALSTQLSTKTTPVARVTGQQSQPSTSTTASFIFTSNDTLSMTNTSAAPTRTTTAPSSSLHNNKPDTDSLTTTFTSDIAETPTSTKQQPTETTTLLTHEATGSFTTVASVQAISRKTSSSISTKEVSTSDESQQFTTEHKYQSPTPTTTTTTTMAGIHVRSTTPLAVPITKIPGQIVSTTTASNKPRYFCPGLWIRDERKGNYFFPKTDVFDEVRHNCQHGSSKRSWQVKRGCSWDRDSERGYWGEFDLTYCLTKTKEKGIIVDIENVKLTQENAAKSLQYISTTVADNKNLIQTKLDFDVIVNTTHDIFQVISTPFEKEVLSNILSIVGKLIQLKKELLSAEALNQINGIFKMIGHRFDKSIRSVVDINGNNVALCLKKVKSTSSSISFATRSSHHGNITLIRDNDNGDGKSFMRFPKETFAGISGGGVTSVLFHEMVASPNFMAPHTNETVVSNIMSAEILTGKSLFDKLKEPVVINFQLKNVDDGMNISCRFWNETTASWSINGCHLHSWNKKSGDALCKCYHLTSFAVIGVKSKSKHLEDGWKRKDNFLLNLIAFVGSFISVLLLGVTLITYLCIRDIREHVNSKSISCFCLSLILTIIAFVASITFVTQAMTCFIVGRLLHYFVLTSFCWMLVQAVNLYRSIVIISVRRTDAHYFKWMSLIAWGVPLIIMAVTGFFTYKTQFLMDYRTDICFVKDAPFYCSVLLPTVLLLVANFSIFVPIFKNIINTEELVKDTIENKSSRNAKRAKYTLMVTSTAALVWIVAIFSGAYKILALQYMFHILIPLIGVTVFVLYVLLNDDAKNGWKDWGSCCSSSRERRDAAPPEMVQLRSKKSLLDSDKKDEHRISIVINGDLYGYGTETFGATPKLLTKQEALHKSTTTPKVKRKTEATTV